MPRRVQNYDDYGTAVQQIILSSTDAEFLDQLIPVLKDATNTYRAQELTQNLSQYAEDRDAEIERIGLTKHEEFLSSVNQLQDVQERTVDLTTEILKLNQSIQASTEKLAEQKQALVNTRAVRENISEVSDALKESLRILHAVNHAHELIRKKKYYGALKSLDDLQSEFLVPIIQNKYATQHKLAGLIQKSIRTSQKTISEAVMTDLNTWLFRIRETSQFLGEVAFYHTNMRRDRQRQRIEGDEFLSQFKLNSAIELVFDESEEFDVLDNEELQVDFTPLFEALHIHDALGQSDKFRSEYAATRRRQKELLLPSSISLTTDDESSLSSLLESISGFAIIEKATMRRAPQLRSSVDVEELWDSMCTAAISLTSKALSEVTNAEVLLKIKLVIALFIQTMEGWGYSVSRLDDFLLDMFDKYAELLKKRFSEDFQEIVSTDDYMPMAINSKKDYENVVNVSWFSQEQSVDDLTFPCVLPFSQMYPLCCIDIRNFLNQFYFFADDHFQHPAKIDESLRKSLDELLTEKVCKSLVERLSSQYLGQIVQILINLEHFETACRELEQLLMRARSSASAGGPLTLDATEQFRDHKKTAEKRIFELVNSKIDDLVETAEYDWTAPQAPLEPSNYMQTLTRYLSNIMNSTLLGLPREIKELIYFDALSHAAEKILALPLSSDVKKINPHGVQALAQDVQHLTDFVDGLENGFMLRSNLDELEQTILLLQAENADEFFDISTRNKKYGRVDALNGPILLEKLTQQVSSTGQVTARFANFSSNISSRFK
ncbi:exocyst complex subunit Sec15-like-domain-containing protein [Microdochium trichocladiopsis]|uniref:Exocyst complex component SEC15 n=1 Tax=Microdochium trichocladiopsis TaxID=1682393 RepID=A0A9P8YEF2_9PEZI|nr:exocyst complex subunit Sec15-like-domain-containing protein [Microdochium trichocladiopsis]KAH7037818.1 exocyst complex subunit Sec15-like-domain-containing protein [Microdochium trichocladiopsis]